MSVAANFPANVIVATAVVFLVFAHISYRFKNTFYAWLGGIALGGHTFISIFLLPYLPYRWDIGKFHRHAVDLLTGIPIESNPTVNSFAAFQALVYAVFGTDPTTISIVNGLIAVLTAIPVASLASRLYPNLQSTKGITAIVLFFPLPFLFLTIPMRDALSVLVFFTILALAARGYHTGERSLWLPTIPLFGILALLRPELAFAILCGIAAATFVQLVDTVSKRRPASRSLIALGGIGGLLTLPIVGPRLPVARIASKMESRTHGGAAYLELVEYEGWVDMLLAAPTRAIYFQFTPFPLHVTGVFDLLAAVMTPVLLVFAIAGYRSVRRCDTDRTILFGLATVYLVGIVGYGLIDANFGTTVRHRIPFTFLLVVAAAPVVERWEWSLREWISQRPGQDRSQHEQQRETQELHGGVRVRTEDAD